MGRGGVFGCLVFWGSHRRATFEPKEKKVARRRRKKERRGLSREIYMSKERRLPTIRRVVSNQKAENASLKKNCAHDSKKVPQHRGQNQSVS